MSTIAKHLEGERSVSTALGEQPGQERDPLAAALELLRRYGHDPTAERSSSTWLTRTP